MCAGIEPPGSIEGPCIPRLVSIGVQDMPEPGVFCHGGRDGLGSVTPSIEMPLESIQRLGVGLLFPASIKAFRAIGMLPFVSKGVA